MNIVNEHLLAMKQTTLKRHSARFRDTGLLQLAVTKEWEKLAANALAVLHRKFDKNHKTVAEQ